MERMALKMFARWTDLQSLMKDYTLLALEGEDAVAYANRGKYADDYILKEYKKIVRRVWGVAFPEVFSEIYKEAKAVRDKLAHMIEVQSIEGEQPHRVMTIVRSKGFEKYEDGKWLQHRYNEQIREEDLVRALRDVDEARKMLHIIFNLGAMFREMQPSDDDIWDFHWIPWWDGRWGQPPTHPTEGLRAPVGRYRHHFEPGTEQAYWDPDESKWYRYQHDDD
ncbi:hypothetical protein [Mycobacterium sp.]|uniref:hypothetical protein n=1 Tax=Mycobacterium sp. TaxID=1785 RepID=UPI003BABF2D0